MNLASLSRLELRHEIDNLQAAYIRCIDDGELEQWPLLFAADGLYKIIAQENADRGLPLAAMLCDSRGMLADRVVSLRHANIYEKHQYRHIVSGALIQAPDLASVRVRSNYVVYRTRTNGVTEVFSTGRYDDLIVVDDGQLRYREKIVTFDTNRIDSLLVTPL